MLKCQQCLRGFQPCPNDRLSHNLNTHHCAIAPSIKSSCYDQTKTIFNLSTIAMTTLLKPSTLIPKGLRVQQINNLALFKFTDELGDRLQTLLDKKKADSLTSDETLELESIGELDEIFSYINAVIAARANGHT